MRLIVVCIPATMWALACSVHCVCTRDLTSSSSSTMLYACGSNGNGQLGLGHYDDVNEWTPIDLQLAGEIEISAGGNHTVILEKFSGKAYITQSARFHELKHPHSVQWSMISAGWAFTILIDAQNNLWSIGDGPSGELGLGRTTQTTELTRLQWKSPSQIADLRSGVRHTVLLTVDGKLYGWGASRKEQCGTESRSVDAPREFPPSEFPATKIACGRDFTAVIRSNGLLELWGDRKRFLSSEAPYYVDPSGPLLSGWSAFVVEESIFGNTSQSKLDSCSFRGQIGAMGSEHVLSVDGQTVNTYGWGEHGNCPPATPFQGFLRVFGGCATSFVHTA